MDESRVKIVVTEGSRVETLWAHPLGRDLFRLDNLPFWAYGISVEDVVEARPDDSGRPALVRVARKSGNRTMRVILRPAADEAPTSRAVLDGLIALGCGYEGLHPGYVAVNVPPTVALERVAAFLTASDQEWEYVDPTYEDLYPDEPAETSAPEV